MSTLKMIEPMNLMKTSEERSQPSMRPKQRL